VPEKMSAVSWQDSSNRYLSYLRALIFLRLLCRNNAPADCGQIDRVTAQDDYPLVTIRPSWISQNCLERLAAYHDRVDAGDKLVVALGFASALRKKV
jgi:hypothetical protein